MQEASVIGKRVRGKIDKSQFGALECARRDRIRLMHYSLNFRLPVCIYEETLRFQLWILFFVNCLGLSMKLQ